MQAFHPPSAAPAADDGRFRQLFEQAPVSIQILRPDGSTRAVNRAWEDLWQIRAGSKLHAYVLSPAYNVLTDPQLQDSGVAPLMARACAGEAVRIPAIRYDVATLGGSGPARWVAARVHPIRNPAGAVLEIMLMHEDITERIESENALRIREERFRSLVMATSQMVWCSTADGRQLDDSPSWRAYTGQTYDELKEFGWADALHPDDVERMRARWSECVASGAVFETEHRIRRADGAWRWVAVKGVPIVDADGSVREWIGANTDIHDGVMARLEQARRLEREQRNSALLAKVAQAARELHTALSSQHIADTLAREVRAILGVEAALVTLDEGEDGAPPLQVAHGDADAAAVRLAAPLVDRKGRRIGMVEARGKGDGAFNDEDDAILVQLAAIAANGFENARLYGALQEQHRSKDEFLAMLAHELRNPLAPIAAAADMLKLCHVNDTRVARASDVVSRQVRHLASLVDDLLDVSRVTRGLIQIRSVPVDLMETVAGAVEQARPLVEARGHRLLVDAGAGAVQVTGDPNRLVQVLVNLLNNAAKYTPPGGTIRLALVRHARSVSVKVADDGIGIDARLLPRVFELFTQAERNPDRAQGGLGIGLALVKNIVTLHGGTVTARSDGPGAGSEFTVTLATAGEAADDAE